MPLFFIPWIYVHIIAMGLIAHIRELLFIALFLKLQEFESHLIIFAVSVSQLSIFEREYGIEEILGVSLRSASS